MAAVASLRKERQAALHDTDLQLKLKAGQVRISPTLGVNGCEINPPCFLCVLL
jgi:hypothetical protein